MSFHDENTGTDNHGPYVAVFADAAARLADATTYQAHQSAAGGSNPVRALQIDDGSEYYLSNHSPTVWTATAGGGGGVNDHGSLAGLADDDHTQYLLVAGTRAMTGALDMGGQAITNVGNVDGVDVSGHGARHAPGAADALATAAPVNVTKAANAEGVAVSFARSDHKHDVTTAAPAQGIGGANSEGSATSLARSDHNHALRESGGTDLTIGAIADGQALQRSGTTIVGGTPPLPIGFVSGMQLSYVSAAVVQAEAGICRDDTNTVNIELTASAQCSLAVSGAGGLLAALTEAANTSYDILVIWGSGPGTALLAVLEGTSPALPAGYTHKRRIGWVRNDSALDIRNFFCHGAGRERQYFMKGTLTSRTVLNAATAATWTALSLATMVRLGQPYLVGLWVFNNVYTYTEFRPSGDTSIGNGEGIRVNPDDVGAGGSHIEVLTDASAAIDVRRINGGGGSFVLVAVNSFKDVI